MSDTTPVALAEELLAAVRALAGGADAWEAKRQVQQLADAVTRAVLGPLDYTVMLAGAPPSLLSHRSGTDASGQRR